MKRQVMETIEHKVEARTFHDLGKGIYLVSLKPGHGFVATQRNYPKYKSEERAEQSTSRWMTGFYRDVAQVAGTEIDLWLTDHDAVKISYSHVAAVEKLRDLPF